MFRVYTDFAANLPNDLIAQYDIAVVPVICCIDGEPLDVSGGFDGHAFYDRIRAGAQTQTSMPSIGTFTDCFEQALTQGEDIIYIAMSGGISGTVNVARSVAAELMEERPERRIAVIDSHDASLGEGLPAVYAAKLRQEGKDFDEAVRLTEEYTRVMTPVFTVDDLSHLKRTGRLYAAAAKVGNLLQVKPILGTDDEGHIVLKRMMVGRRRALDTLAARYRDTCGDRAAAVGLAHADCEADALYVIDKLRDAGCTGEITTVMYDPVTGSHVGPGTVALFFSGERR